MKKKNKQRITVIIILVLFGISPIAFIGTGIYGGGQQQVKLLESFVNNGKINDLTKGAYIQGGYTFLTYDPDTVGFDLEQYMDSLPSQTQTIDGQTQLVVEKTLGSNERVTITNINVYEEIENVTREHVFESLCNSLLITPLECGLNSLNITR